MMRPVAIIALISGLCLAFTALPGCSYQRSENYWVLEPCEEHPSDSELKPGVAAELEQYAAQFTALLTGAVDSACAGDYSMLRRLRSETGDSMIPFVPEGVKSENFYVKQRGEIIPLRIYSPLGYPAAVRCPVVVYIHGGGWVSGSLSGAEHIAASICRTSGSVVISVDYRLAPENPYPAGLIDCRKAIEWARLNATRYNGDPSRIYLAGDSAGGNLAASAAVFELMNSREIKGIILYYPAIDLAGPDTWSMKRFATGYGLDSVLLEKLIRCYIPDPVMRSGYGASPINADVRFIPPALIITAQFDILHDDVKKFAMKLSVSGNRVRYICIRGVTHAYLDSPCCGPELRLTMKETAGFILRTSATSVPVAVSGDDENHEKELTTGKKL